MIRNPIGHQGNGHDDQNGRPLPGRLHPIADGYPHDADDRTGRPVRCEHDDTDRYGRIVTECFIGQNSLNAWMVHEGMAVITAISKAEVMSELEVRFYCPALIISCGSDAPVSRLPTIFGISLCTAIRPIPNIPPMR
ncbi:thermonuclease family protein [Skermanella rosea]|uniref:thermonuclease family protein n=1 Tax=Skermanella rosea TaxID=1817965 RepID=UPI001934B603|nr:thermonuclease family protein [Skermanella rosea]UEM03281.1 thermonuclease family protein [Skermanella rosea]